VTYTLNDGGPYRCCLFEPPIISHFHELRLIRRRVVFLLNLQRCIRTQPQRDVRGLHRLPHYPHQATAQSVDVGLVSELGRVRSKQPVLEEGAPDDRTLEADPGERVEVLARPDAASG
jgi:hypothetical protein